VSSGSGWDLLPSQKREHRGWPCFEQPQRPVIHSQKEWTKPPGKDVQLEHYGSFHSHLHPELALFLIPVWSVTGPVTSPLTYLSYIPSPLAISFTSSPTPFLILTLFSCVFHVSPNLLYIASLPLAHYLHCISLYMIPFFLCESLFWDFLVPEDGGISLLWNAGNYLHMYMVSHPRCGVRISYLDLTTDSSLPQPTVEDDFRCPSEDKTELVIQCNNYRHTRESEGSCK
jgi:hypothetical protein